MHELYALWSIQKVTNYSDIPPIISSPNFDAAQSEIGVIRPVWSNLPKNEYLLSLKDISFRFCLAFDLTSSWPVCPQAERAKKTFNRMRSDQSCSCDCY